MGPSKKRAELLINPSLAFENPPFPTFVQHDLCSMINVQSSISLCCHLCHTLFCQIVNYLNCIVYQHMVHWASEKETGWKNGIAIRRCLFKGVEDRSSSVSKWFVLQHGLLWSLVTFWCYVLRSFYAFSAWLYIYIYIYIYTHIYIYIIRIDEF